MRVDEDRTDRSQQKGEFNGCIADVRAVEDCIRATRNYTEGVWQKKHPDVPIQGGDFPSRTLKKLYEVYPGVEVTWDMPIGTAVEWLWSPKVRRIAVVFFYRYSDNFASMTVSEGAEAVKELETAIPKLKKVLDKVRIAEGTLIRQPRVVRVVEPRVRAVQRLKELGNT